MMLEVIALLFLKQPEPAHRAVLPSPPQRFFAGSASIIRRDKQFRLLVAVRLLAGAYSMAVPFYMDFALDAFRRGNRSIGVFTAAQVLGSIVSAPFMARMSERRGTRAVIRLPASLALAIPLVGFLAWRLAPQLGGVGLLLLCGFLFALLGSTANGNAAGFLNCLLELAPAAERPAYVGIVGAFRMKEPRYQRDTLMDPRRLAGSCR